MGRKQGRRKLVKQIEENQRTFALLNAILAQMVTIQGGGMSFPLPPPTRDVQISVRDGICTLTLTPELPTVPLSELPQPKPALLAEQVEESESWGDDSMEIPPPQSVQDPIKPGILTEES